MPIIQVENGYIYKKNTKGTRHAKAKFLFVLFLISVLVIGFTLFAFTKVDFTSTLKLNNFLIFESKSYYAVSVCSGSSYAEAGYFANDIKLQDGAGYVFFDGTNYQLLASVYKTKQDAETVASNLTNFNASVVKIEFNRLILSSNYTSSQIEQIKYSLDMVNRFYEKVYDICLAFDRNEILDAEAKQKLQVFKESCQEDKESLSKCFQNSSDKIATYVKIFQSEVISNLSMLIVSQNLSSDMKYSIISTFASFQTLQKNIKK